MINKLVGIPLSVFHITLINTIRRVAQYRTLSFSTLRVPGQTPSNVLKNVCTIVLYRRNRKTTVFHPSTHVYIPE